MKRTLAVLAAVSTLNVATPSFAGDTPWIGEISMVGFGFCPRGWTDADGKLLSISQHTALFSLYGTVFGGDGRTTFGVPDLRGRAAIGLGNGPGLSPRAMGQKSGNENTTLIANNIPAHTHPATGIAKAANLPGNSPTPGGAFNAIDTAGTNYHALSGGQTPVDMAANSVAVTVNNNNTINSAFSNMSPFLVMRYCVSLNGTFPSRN